MSVLIELAQQTVEGAGAGGGLTMGPFIRGAISSLLYSTIGLVMFGVAFFIITRVAPFSIRKEIEDDQNTSLGIVIGSVIIGIAMIVSAAIHG